MTELIRLVGIEYSYRAARPGRSALRGIELEAGAGEVIGVIGPNGAGKTTLLRLLAGELKPETGTIEVLGKPATTRQSRSLVGFVSDPPALPGELTGTELLRYLASHRAPVAATTRSLVAGALEIGDIADFADRPCRRYSRGMLQQVGLAAALMLAERVLLLDETLAALDPLVIRSVRSRLLEFARNGGIVFVSSHDLGAVERLATRAIVVARGELRADVPMRRLLKERILEIGVKGASLAAVDYLTSRFPGSSRTGDGVSVPLRGDLTVEGVLAECHASRIGVTGTRLRYRGLEDLIVDVTGRDRR